MIVAAEVAAEAVAVCVLCAESSWVIEDVEGEMDGGSVVIGEGVVCVGTSARTMASRRYLFLSLMPR